MWFFLIGLSKSTATSSAILSLYFNYSFYFLSNTILLYAYEMEASKLPYDSSLNVNFLTISYAFTTPDWVLILWYDYYIIVNFFIYLYILAFRIPFKNLWAKNNFLHVFSLDPLSCMAYYIIPSMSYNWLSFNIFIYFWFYIPCWKAWSLSSFISDSNYASFLNIFNTWVVLLFKCLTFWNF